MPTKFHRRQIKATAKVFDSRFIKGERPIRTKGVIILTSPKAMKLKRS